MKAPFPYFGGKSTIAPVVWERLGDVPNKDYIRVKEEPDKAGIMAHYEKLDLKAIGVKRLVEPDVFFLALDGEK
jgi:hypothetical protein